LLAVVREEVASSLRNLAERRPGAKFFRIILK
jgi:hypothetical protein